MILAFIFAVSFTIGVSALCSILEAMILSTTTAEIESLKKRLPKRGELLERYKLGLEETTSAILSLNTIANTLGATMVGGLAVKIWADSSNVLFNVSATMAIAILFISEIIPKNVGVLYRASLQPFLIYPLTWICTIMTPISRVVGILVRVLLKPPQGDENDNDEEIMLLAEKSEKEGTLTSNEREVINNALSLDEIQVEEIMTPRTVMYTIDDSETIGSLFERERHIPFARIPVFHENSDNISGIVRRRDILSAKADDQDELVIAELAHAPIYIPENATADNALQMFLKKHQQLAIVVDEFGSTSGVVTMEDVIEHIIGQEIYEDDDPAVDMRDLARRRQFAEKRTRRKEH
ncbi:CNNM domain-containing protein [Coraliomargarita akajimensis]|uniref:CBS domain containing protein n=1 Tax=Coraliomargarita akajimensis (strain DSM 45221 / IAM 15411 / JCM 23193 / KCTC 12865 / 04OKA010-24) TaxID=583355 RepID=D5EJF7_CORAD|nr:hemolysin family protein [Coraliomargarita akajimensis]ADE54556.1 CBS domain containing protein [Coraliomargarita akajimensis DSM 45221]